VFCTERSSTVTIPVDIEDPLAALESVLEAVQNIQETEDIKHTPIVVPEFGVNKMVADVVLVEYDGDRDEEENQHGIGSALFKNEGKYNGEFRRNLMHGNGTYVWSNKTQYRGSFLDNQVTGIGKYQWANKSFYEGEVLNGLRHGRGQFLGSKFSYEGMWQFGKRSGKGLAYYNAERTSYYDGEWQEGMRHGYGVLQYKSGNTYSGEWVNDKKCGKGLMEWKDRGETYDGDWLDGKPHGFGVQIWLEDRAARTTVSAQMCNRYEGYWHQGVREGFGVFFFANGSKYEGNFKNNKKNGYGVFTHEDGSVTEGTFDDDRCTHNVTKSRGRIQLDIDDLLANVTDREEELRQIVYVLLRSNSDLQAWYKKYAGMCLDDDSRFTMSLNEFWKFVAACDIPCPHVTLAVIDRMFLAMRQREHEQSQKEAQVAMALNETLTETIRSPMKSAQDVHDRTRPILYREFVEAIVRIAINKYGSSQQLSLPSKQLQHLIGQIGDKPMQSVEQVDDQDDVIDHAQVFADRQGILHHIFKSYASRDNAFLMLNADNDQTMTMLEFMQFLKDADVACQEFGMRDVCTIVFKQMFDYNPLTENIDPFDESGILALTDALDVELVYWEFQNSLGAICRKHIVIERAREARLAIERAEAAAKAAKEAEERAKAEAAAAAAAAKKGRKGKKKGKDDKGKKGKKDKGKTKKGKDKDDKGKKGKSGKQKGKKDKNASRPNTPLSDTERATTPATDSGAEGEEEAAAATTAAAAVVEKIPSPRPELPFEEEFPLWLDRVIDRWNLHNKYRS